ncbi:MAG: M23 family metallopeptidase [Nitrospiraceae bacterium]|nr:M23 family metallopeptidase [Nitrospiraceae bacterium]
MKIPAFPILILLSLLSLLCAVREVHAFSVAVSPARISAGDAFLVRVEGIRGNQPVSVELKGRSFPVASCGKGCSLAVGSVDMEMRPGRYRVFVRQGARLRKVLLAVRPTAFPSLHLTLPEEKVSPGEEDMKRIEKEAEKVRLVMETVSERMWEGDFVRPVAGAVATSFGVRRIINNHRESIHRGVDLRGAAGERIRAANRGRVVLAEDLFFGGNTLILDHGQGIYTIYMHLSAFSANPGDVTEKGAVIGSVGSTGRSSGPHLHFGARVLGVSTNPVSLLRLKP